NMFVNGNYYGIYHIQEHPDEDYMGTYYPGGSEDYHFTTGATNGSQHDTESWSGVWSQLKASLNNYTQAKRWVDVTNLADYMILSFYAGNDWDWSEKHNWAAAGPRLPDWGGWKFFQQDQDISLQALNANSTDQTVPDGLFGALMTHADFRVLFRDRIYKHLFHDGVLTPAKAAGYYDLRALEIYDALVAETARWQPPSSVGPLPWDRNGEWTVERNYLMNTYFPQRTAVQLTQFRNRGWYPVDTPEMSRRGGAVDPGTQILLTAPVGASIYYTLDGSDPRLPGGAVSPSAIAYSATVNSRTLVEAHDDVVGRGAVWKYWVNASGPGTEWKSAAFDDGAWPQGAVECGYGDGDEVTNVGFVDTDLSTSGDQRNITTYFRHVFQVADPSAVTGLVARLKRDDGAIVYLNGQEIFRSAMAEGEVTHTTPGNGGAGVADDGNTWFTKTLGPVEYTLLSGANLLAVEVHNASAASSDISFDFELVATQPITPQPIVIEAAAVLKARARLGNEWSAVNEAAFFLTGTQPAGAASLTLTEIHYHPEGEGKGDTEFLEFTNTADYAIDLTDVKLGTAVVFTFPAGIVMRPGEAVVVVKDPGLFDARYRTAGSPWYKPGVRVAGSWSGSLANGGEEILVLDAAGGTICEFAWSDEGEWPGRADGRGSSLELRAPAEAPATVAEKNIWLAAAVHWRPSSEFHGSPGRAGAGPDRRIVINEALSASVAPAVDFIELLNVSGIDQSVGHWFLSDSSDDYRKYRLPAGLSVAPGGWLVLDETHFNNLANPGCLVPFALSASGDDVFLIEADAEGNLLKFADRIEFGSAPGGLSWGLSPDGAGSLELLRAPSVGAANAPVLLGYGPWVAGTFPPGSASSLTGPSGDPDGDASSNWAEFAFVTDPLTADQPDFVLTAGPEGRVTVVYRIRDDAAAVAAGLAVSQDLT
ncbi:MAG: lamin tail domain-containing protein, partial [Verrucomicrobiales bacterium]